MKIDFEETRCCDECGEVAYTMFICPKCKAFVMACSGSLIDPFNRDDYNQDEIDCEKCGAEFKAIKMEGSVHNWEWESKVVGL